VHKFAILKPIRAAGSIYPGNPQTPQITPAISPIAVGIPLGLHEGLVGTAK
jgi:hypothetical protein